MDTNKNKNSPQNSDQDGTVRIGNISEPRSTTQVDPLPEQISTVAGTSKGADRVGNDSDMPKAMDQDSETHKKHRTKLSGAARKRFRMLRAANMSAKEASVECLKPWKDIKSLTRQSTPIPVDQRASKRTRSEEESPGEHSKKAPKIHPEEGIKPNFREVVGSSRVGIKNESPMEEDQMQLVHRSLLTLIKNITVRGSGPKFLGFTHRPGWILITCENQKSQDWLVGEIPNLKPWPEAKLSIMTESEMPKPLICTTFFPSSEVANIKDALSLLTNQNEGIFPEYWKILNSREEKNGHIVTFSIDEPSVETLRKTDYRATLGFRKISFKIRGESTNPPENRAIPSYSNKGKQMPAPTQRGKEPVNRPSPADGSIGAPRKGSKPGNEQGTSQSKSGRSRPPMETEKPATKPTTPMDH